jgi:3-dehydroquinate synthase
MTNSLLAQIKEASKEVDKQFLRKTDHDLERHTSYFPIPPTHPRASNIEYGLYVGSAKHCAEYDERDKNPEGKFTLIDRKVSVELTGHTVQAIKNRSHRVKIVDAEEGKLKTLRGIEAIANKHQQFSGVTEVTAIGGGLVCNVAAYIAERAKAKRLVLVPTTLLAMADCSGGKVRLNANEGEPKKHIYKSFFEPNAIIVDPRFIESLPATEIANGMAEVIKHGLFQSDALLAYVMRNHKNIMPQMSEWNASRCKPYILRAALWTAELKNVCLRIDPYEQSSGSREILRAGHDYSDRIEEQSRFTVRHGYAVAQGIVRELERKRDDRTLKKAKEAFEVYGLATA